MQITDVDPFYIKKNDLQPPYYGQIKDSNGLPVPLTGATLRTTMKHIALGTIKIDRQTTGIYITDDINGKFEYRWQAGETNTAGRYSIEFEVTPLSGGKYTVPVRNKALVIIMESEDTI